MLNDLWRFSGAPPAQSAFAATLAPLGGERLVLADEAGNRLLQIEIGEDRLVQVSGTTAAMGKTATQIALREALESQEIGFHFEFHDSTLTLLVAGIPCFSTDLDEGLKRTRRIQALGQWLYPCSWQLYGIARPLARIRHLSEVTESLRRSTNAYQLCFGASAAIFVADPSIPCVVIEPDPVRMHEIEIVLGAVQGIADRIYVQSMMAPKSRAGRAGGTGFVGLLPDRSSYLMVPGEAAAKSVMIMPTPLLSLSSIIEALGIPQSLIAPDTSSAELVLEEYPFEPGGVGMLVAPLSTDIAQWMPALGFFRFRFRHRQTLARTVAEGSTDDQNSGITLDVGSLQCIARTVGARFEGQYLVQGYAL